MNSNKDPFKHLGISASKLAASFKSLGQMLDKSRPLSANMILNFKNRLPLTENWFSEDVINVTFLGDSSFKMLYDNKQLKGNSFEGELLIANEVKNEKK